MAVNSPSTGSAEAFLAPRLEQRIVPGLDRMFRVLDAVGHPERRFPALLVVGTNGKGSTAALLASVVHAHGLKVGLYTSPHLIRVEERIRVDSAPIEPERLLELLRELHAFPELSYFETLTAAALIHFANEGVALAVLEAGLGGRWDATNAVDPVASLLTNVGTDHQAWLGETRVEIAAEKAAALRGRDAIVGAWDDEVEGTIRAHAAPSTPLSVAASWALVRGNRGQGAGERKTGSGLGALGSEVHFAIDESVGSARLPLQGLFQLDNLQLALAGAAALARHRVIPPLAADAICRGIEATHWPGRFQKVNWNGRTLVLDGAHNAEATAALVDALEAAGLVGELDLLFSCLDDKPLARMAGLLASRVRGVTVVPIDSPRATPVEKLAEAFPGCRTADRIVAALALLTPGSATLVTGSLRLVGDTLRIIGSNHG